MIKQLEVNKVSDKERFEELKITPLMLWSIEDYLFYKRFKLNGE